MDGGGATVRIPKGNNNQIINQLQTISRKLTEFDTKFEEVENGYRNWLYKQSFPVGVTVFTVSNVIQGAAFGGLMGAAAQVAGHVFPQHSLAIKFKTFFACVMIRIRGKEDVQTMMAADFVSGATCRLMKRMGEPYVAAEAVIVGVVCALFRGGFLKLREKTSELPVEYARTKCMLSNLGLQNYEKNFEKGLLTDSTMPFLTGSVLKEVGVPPGPRLLILNHVERDPELQKMREGRAG
ncbi:hypothetical protein MKW98_022922 [Papaver atlanticum]|uniref:SAM domain-containing protein n=1 Tax=Papaver atlanticum TaxID=357466 RepID=A0AAD4TNR7_9MAGN|nr:hypothetical protein MKW98_022922 [Papaver atlanticum]